MVHQQNQYASFASFLPFASNITTTNTLGSNMFSVRGNPAINVESLSLATDKQDIWINCLIFRPSFYLGEKANVGRNFPECSVTIGETLVTKNDGF